MEATVYNEKGEKAKTIALPEEMFSAPFSDALIHQAALAQFANARLVHAHTKGRGDVRGGGVKPWRQKGTGRARHGSIRSPLWIGGGVTFGPTKERNFAKKINKKMKRGALFGALSRKMRDGEIFFLERWAVDKSKTKTLHAFLENFCDKVIPGCADRTSLPSMLLVHEGNDSLVRASRNIPSITAIRGDSLNVGELLRHHAVIFSLDGFSQAKGTFLSSSQTSPQESLAGSVQRLAGPAQRS